MSFTKFYLPAAGLHVIDPSDLKPLPPEGKQVKGNQTYWLRREADASVTEGQPPKAGKSK